MPEITVKDAIEALVQHAAQNRDPGILAAIKHIEGGLNGQSDQRPMDRHDSPGMRAAKAHTRPEYRNRAKDSAQKNQQNQTAKGESQPTKETSSDE